MATKLSSGPTKIIARIDGCSVANEPTATSDSTNARRNARVVGPVIVSRAVSFWGKSPRNDVPASTSLVAFGYMN
jgi:hypothetical protein